MKKSILTGILVFVLSLTALPSFSFAVEQNDPNLDKFLTSINWEKQAYIDYLSSKEWTLEDFDSIDQLGTPLTEEAVQSVLAEYNLSREELNELLIENGDIEIGEDVLDGTYLIFSEELIDSIDFYIGTPINDTNLQELLDYYEFDTVDQLEAFLNSYDDSIENYEFIEDLDLAIDFYMNVGEIDFEEIYDLFDQIGLTEQEIEAIFTHLETLDFEDPASLDKLLELSERMIQFEEFESAEELTAEQIAELLDIFDDLLDLLHLDTKYYLVKDGEKKPITFDTLLTMDTTNGYDLLIELYSTSGQFLADILFTAEMVGSDIIQETGRDIIEAKEIVTTKPVVTKEHIQTVKGGKLPKTASNYPLNALIGIGFIMGGFLLFRKFKVRGTN
ncbi:processed acidic surface protein [Bacillus weihaiensis]|uniref:processed acidic surface protein n=1 Tax=Bacillus weihaiensis TaxID=1547283 RepID=UPI002353788E|nr:processed acidic surface protein [Bacillus weihaiensis]